MKKYKGVDEKLSYACEVPLDAFRYCPPGTGSLYCMVDLDMNNQESDDNKCVGKQIEIGFADLIKAHFLYIKDHLTKFIGGNNSLELQKQEIMEWR